MKSIESKHIGKHLSEIIDGEVLTDDVSRILYSSAACIYEMEPLAIVRPQDVEDVSRLIGF